MKNTFILLVIVLFITPFANAQNKAYMNNKLSIDQRVELLMKQMTVEEKAMQLINMSFAGIKQFVDKDGNVDIEALKKAYPNGLGGINLEINFGTEKYIKVGNQFQRYAQNVGNGIPIMLIGEGLHGLMSKEATVFPQAISIGCSWDTVLMEKVGTVTALEASARGIRQLLSPVLDLGREPRFGRIEEMFSEDPYLVAELGKAVVNGFQGRSTTPDKFHAAATLKHFAGHGIPEGGRNTAPVDISTYDLLNEHIYPFEQVIKYAKPLCVMPSYNEINGIPNHANRWLLTDILRKQFGYKDLVTADQNAIDETYRQHALVETAEDAAKLAITNGIDIDIQYNSGTYSTLTSLVKSGKLPIEILNNSVRRFLKLKFALGLFDNSTSDATNALTVTNSEENKKLALEAAEKSMVLLKNENSTLPFTENNIKNLAVIGPLAKGVQFGGYSVEPNIGTDVLTGLTHYGTGKFNVFYAEGCKIAKEAPAFWDNYVHTPNSPEDDRRLIAEAVEIAKKSDAVVLAMGESVSFAREAWGEFHRGDRSNIDLLGLQNELLEKILSTGKPVVVLMFGGRPLSFNYVAKNSPSIIQCFYLGQETGYAVANVIFGKTNPSGKMAVTIPKSVGELPCFYSRKPTRSRSYINEENAPIFPFGFGLSYTTFEYSAPKIDKSIISKKQKAIVTVDIKNTGKVEGEEVAQLYIRDMISSGVRPVMELRDFAKVSIKPGETKTVKFTITPEKLMFYNYDFKKVLEAGDFRIMVGSSSQKTQELMLKVQE